MLEVGFLETNQAFYKLYRLQLLADTIFIEDKSPHVFNGTIFWSSIVTNLLRRLKAETLPDATQLISKKKICITTFKPLLQF